MYNKNNFHQKMQIKLKSFYDSQTKEKGKIYIKKSVWSRVMIQTIV